MAGTQMTLQEAADLLGVHYMTAYRYVRHGLLQAHKEGSSWRVDAADVEAFRSGGSSPDAEVERGRRRRAPWAERLEARLLAGDSRGAWGVLEAALGAGADQDQLYLEVIAPALASIGDAWARGEVDIAVEHRASGIAMRLLGRLGPRFARRGRTRGTVVLGTPAGEQHSLPAALVADLLRADGWDVSDLGADLPAESFATAAQAANRLVAVGVSVTNPACLDAAAETCAVLQDHLPPAVPVFLGGRAVRGEAHALALGADGYASDARGFVALIDEVGRGTFVRAGGGAA